MPWHIGCVLSRREQWVPVVEAHNADACWVKLILTGLPGPRLVQPGEIEENRLRRAGVTTTRKKG